MRTIDVNAFKAIQLRQTRTLAGHKGAPEHIHLTLSEKLEEYRALLGQSSMFTLGLIVQLMAAGKVKVQFRGYSERVELVHTEDRMTRAKAIALVGECLIPGSGIGSTETNSEITQNIFLQSDKYTLTGGSQVNRLTPQGVSTTFPQSVSREKNVRLSEREEKILQLLVSGLIKKEIAVCLNLSLHTVDTYIRRIYEKLNVKTRAEAVLNALRQKLV